jgi:hypothetical protein
VQWNVPVIPALKGLRKADQESQASLGYRARPCLQKLYNNHTKSDFSEIITGQQTLWCSTQITHGPFFHFWSPSISFDMVLLWTTNAWDSVGRTALRLREQICLSVQKGRSDWVDDCWKSKVQFALEWGKLEATLHGPEIPHLLDFFLFPAPHSHLPEWFLREVLLY